MRLVPEQREPARSPERSEALAEPVNRVGPGWVALYVLANAGVFFPMHVPTTFLMPEQIAQIDPAGKVGSYAWVSMMGAISGIVIAPLAGALSDRTTGRLGRRRPWLLAGSLVCVATLVLTGLQTTVAGSRSPPSSCPPHS